MSFNEAEAKSPRKYVDKDCSLEHYQILLQ